MKMVKTVVLASQSPRRRELLAQMGVPFAVAKLDVPEVRRAGEAPVDYVVRLAREKAEAGAKVFPESLVIGSDTLVECDGAALEKPKNQTEGLVMLQALSGRSHFVHTAVAVSDGDTTECVLVTSRVTFREIAADEALRYWQTGEPCDKAGGYGIQGFGGVFVTRLEGSYSAVMGLPVAETQQLLAARGVPCWQAACEPTQ